VKRKADTIISISIGRGILQLYNHDNRQISLDPSTFVLRSAPPRQNSIAYSIARMNELEVNAG
jgi:hypothetical protein